MFMSVILSDGPEAVSLCQRLLSEKAQMVFLLCVQANFNLMLLVCVCMCEVVLTPCYPTERRKVAMSIDQKQIKRRNLFL